MMKPTLGRIVHYMQDNEVYPCIIVHVYEDDAINLVGWSSTGLQLFRNLVPYSNEIAKDNGHWFWPPMPIPTAEDMKKIKERIIAQQHKVEQS